MEHKRIGWAIAQKGECLSLDERDRYLFSPAAVPATVEIYYGGGGSKQLGMSKSQFKTFRFAKGPYRGSVPKFVRNDAYAVIFLEKEGAERVALMLGVTEPVLMGRLYLVEATALGIPKAEAK